MSTTEFAHDADLTHPWAQRYRIPLVRTPYPAWRYEVALVIPSDEQPDLWHATWPTEDEAELIGSAIEFRRSWYREGYAAKMLERPLDVDSTTNSLILLRNSERGWQYRLASYEHGPWPYGESPIRFGLDRNGLQALPDYRASRDFWAGHRRPSLNHLRAPKAKV
jgi:hypothetical protein